MEKHQNPIGKVITATGNVSAESEAGTRILQPDSPVFEGDLVITKSRSHVEIEFADQTRLSQGENSEISLDSYVYSPSSDDDSGLLLKMMEGSFRCITGKIVEQNPDNFILKSPLATLGIRGTTVVSDIRHGVEKHGAESISGGKAMVLQDNTGTIKFITTSKSIIDFFTGKQIGDPRPFTQSEVSYFRSEAPFRHQPAEDQDTFPINGSEQSEDAQTDNDQADTAAHKTEQAESVDLSSEPEPSGEFKNIFGPGTDDRISEQTEITPGVFGPPGQTGTVSALFPSLSTEAPAEDTETAPDADDPYVNNPPAASDKTVETLKDTALTGNISATDPDGDPLTFTLQTPPSQGSLKLSPDGSYTYTPAPGYYGNDFFTYRVDDGQSGYDTGTISINVDKDNKQPDADDGTGSTETDMPLLGMLTATDPDGDPLTFSMAEAPANGTLALKPDGSFVYTPNANFYGSDGFVFQVDDGFGGTDTGAYAINVVKTNTPPSAADGTASVNEGDFLAGTLEATDPDGDPLAYSIKTAPQHGDLTLNSDGSFIYTPHADFYGSDGFVFQVDDGFGGTDTGSYAINVARTNAPPAASDGTASVNEGDSLTGSLAAADPDGDPLTFSITTPPENGTLTAAPDGSFTYTPDAGFSGNDTFLFQVDDGFGGTDTGTYTITVNQANTPPTAVDGAAPVAAGGTVSGTLAATDPDGDALTFSITTAPLHGSLTSDPAGSFNYTANPGYWGKDIFTFQADDGNGGTDTGEVAITVGSTNNADVITGTLGNDTIYALGGNDTIDPLDGEDTVYGEEGDDTINMGAELISTDVIDGGPGIDTLTYTDDGSGTDELNGVVNIENIVLGDAPVSVTVTESLVAPGQKLVVDGTGLASPGSNMTWNGVAETDGSFEITSGSGLTNILMGGDQNDMITASTGTNELYGGPGSDTITGGSGADKLFGDQGTDILTGGAGNDIFTYEAGELGDIIKDFRNSAVDNDTIHLDADSIFADAMAGSTLYAFNAAWSASPLLMTAPRTALVINPYTSLSAFTSAVDGRTVSPNMGAVAFGIIGTGTGPGAQRDLFAAVGKDMAAGDGIADTVDTYKIATLEEVWSLSSIGANAIFHTDIIMI